MRYRYLDDFGRGISVFAIFSYGIAVLGTPQCPPRLTVEFYKFFWNIVGELLVASLSYSYDVGELSNSQKKAIIILLGKKDKDKRHI